MEPSRRSVLKGLVGLPVVGTLAAWYSTSVEAHRSSDTPPSVLVGAVLGFTSLGKWLNLQWFKAVLSRYELLPRASTGIVALAIPAIESLISIALLAGIWRPWAAVTAFVLIFLFTLAVLINLVRGRRDLDCGCTGKSSNGKLSWHGIVRNVGLLVLTLVSADYGYESLSSQASVALFLISIALIAWPAGRRYLLKTDPVAA